MSETAMETRNNVTEAAAAGSRDRPERAPGWLIPALLIAGLLIGLLGEVIVASVAARREFDEGGRFGRIFFPPPHGQMGDPPDWLLEVRTAMIKNNAIGYGIFSALLLGAMGALIGVAYRRRSAVVGLLVGGLAGLLAGGICAPISYYIENEFFQVDMDGAIKASLILSAVFLGLGLAGAFVAVCAGPARSAVRAIVNGIVAAAIGLVAYILVAIGVFPIGFPESTSPLDTGVRFTLFVCLGICPALAAILMLRSPAAKAVQGDAP